MLVLGLAAPAAAMPITLTIDFSASGFQAGAPYDPVTGNVTLTFDTAVSVSDQTTGITLNSLSIPLNVATIAYDYVALAPGNFIDRLVIGGSQYGAAGLFPGVPDFALEIDGIAGGTPSFTGVSYTATGFPNTQFGTATGTMTITGLARVTEPSTLALYVFPLALMLGLMRWRRGDAQPGMRVRKAKAR